MTLLAGVAGQPIGHSLSPLIHKAWIAAAPDMDDVALRQRIIDAVDAALARIEDAFAQRERVTAMVTVATGSGYWLQNSPQLRSYVWWLWYVAAPAAMGLFGYFPGRRLKKLGDLPLGVMRQWRAWCLHRAVDYLVKPVPPAKLVQSAQAAIAA
jgi:hypothetical protein